jgi:hypothetical protein
LAILLFLLIHGPFISLSILLFVVFNFGVLTFSNSYGQTVEYGQPITKGGSYGYQIGWDGVSAKYSPSAVLGEIGVKALNRLIDDSKPFALTVNFNAPVRDDHVSLPLLHVALTLLLDARTARTVYQPERNDGALHENAWEFVHRPKHQ